MIDKSLNYGRHILDKFTNQKGVFNLDLILDLGGGKGDDLTIVKKNIPKSNIYAIEYYEPNINLLMEKKINTISLNLEKDSLPFLSESIDLIIANQILEHCKEIFWIFHEISRTLKVGGYIYIGVPNLASLHSRFLLALGLQPTCIKTASAHIRGFTKSDFLNFLHECAPQLFSLELFKGSNFYPFPPSIAAILANLFPNSAVCIFFVLRKQRKYENEFLEFPLKLETNFWVGPK